MRQADWPTHQHERPAIRKACTRPASRLGSGTRFGIRPLPPLSILLTATSSNALMPSVGGAWPVWSGRLQAWSGRLQVWPCRLCGSVLMCAVGVVGAQCCHLSPPAYYPPPPPHSYPSNARGGACRRLAGQCTESLPGVILEGDYHRRSMAKQRPCPSNTRCWFCEPLHHRFLGGAFFNCKCVQCVCVV